MKYLKTIAILLLSVFELSAQIHIQPQATLWVGENAILSIEGAVDNTGSFQNLGDVTFTGDWTNTGVYGDGDTGSLEAIGATSQVIDNGDQSVSTLIVSNGEDVLIDGNTFTVTEDLNLNNGIVRLGANTSLVIETGANITGGSIDSYIEGTVVQMGTGERFFPLGINNTYLPLTLLDVQGIDVELSVGIGLFSTNNIAPQPDLTGSVIGVSEYHYWNLNVQSGTFIGSQVRGVFERADLTNFTNRSEFTFSNSNAAIVYAPAVEGDYNSLRGELTNSDFSVDIDGVGSGTMGTITTEDSVNASGFLAIALVADVPEEGILYIPTAFSPVANNPDDRTFRILADGINRVEDFKVTVYNQFGVEVYSETVFNMANTVGWDGTYKGRDEPMGTYRYFVRFRDGNNQLMKRNGVVILVR